MEVLRLAFLFRFPSLELPKQVRRVSLSHCRRTRTLSPMSSPSYLFKTIITKKL
jgi:hypothetical protein